jgi:recombination associated protein RdgC
LTPSRSAPILPALMPVLRGAVTFSRFRAESAQDAPAETKREPKRWLTEGLKARAFEPIDRDTEEERAQGFVELEDNEATGFGPGALFHGEYALWGYRIDQLKVPGSALRAELTKWASAFEKEKGRPPARGEKAESRSSIRHLLRTRAAPNSQVHDVSWNLKTNQVQIWAASRKAVEEVQQALEAALQVKLVPQVPVAMASRAGISEEALAPTAELIGGEVTGEVGHGEA